MSLLPRTLLATAVLMSSATAWTQDFDFDPAWNSGNPTTIAFDQITQGVDVPADIAVAPNGSVYVVGTVDVSGGHLAGLARLLPNGEPDPAFSGDGRTTIVGPVNYDLTGTRVRVQADGKPIVGGTFTRDNGDLDPFLCRRFVAGNADNTFGGASLGCINFGADLHPDGPDLMADFEVDALGRIWVLQLSDADPVPNGISLRLVVSRRTGAGAVDTSFAGTGSRTYNIAADFGFSVGTQMPHLELGDSGGATIAFQIGGVDETVAMLRLLDNGNYDTSFGPDGVRTLNLQSCESNPCSEQLADFDQLANGDFLISGNFQVQKMPSSLYAMGMIRVDANGDTLASFGAGTSKVIDLFGDVFPSRRLTAVTEMPSGKLIMVGAVGKLGGLNFAKGLTLEDVAVLRFNGNGSIDDSFGGGGRQFYGPNPGQSSSASFHATGVAMQGERPLVVVDYGFAGIQDRDYAVFALEGQDVFADGFE